MGNYVETPTDLSRTHIILLFYIKYEFCHLLCESRQLESPILNMHCHVLSDGVTNEEITKNLFGAAVSSTIASDAFMVVLNIDGWAGFQYWKVIKGTFLYFAVAMGYRYKSKGGQIRSSASDANRRILAVSRRWLETTTRIQI